MARQAADSLTAELLPLDVAPVPAKRGRPCKGKKPMTAAERKRASRAKQAKAATQARNTAIELDAEELGYLCGLLTGQPSLPDPLMARRLLRKLRSASRPM